MKLSELFKIHLTKRLFAVLVTVFCVAFFGLYYIGVFDISFIDRPKSWENNLSEFVSILKKDYKTPKPDEPNDIDKPKDPKPVDTTAPDTAPVNPTPADPEPQVFNFQPVAALRESGYRLTDKIFDQSCVFGILETAFPLPDKLSYSETSYEKEIFTSYEDGRETTREVAEDVRSRYALEMYMGYIIYDDVGTLYLLNSNGEIMNRYDSSFLPAYTRDKEGRPLFYKNKKLTLQYPTEKGPADENGNKEWINYTDLTIDSKQYYYLSANGQYFIESDYNDTTDNRGLYFDYPAYYGTTDSRLSRYCYNSTRVFTDEKGNTTVQSIPRWLYSDRRIALNELSFDRFGKNLDPAGGDDLVTMFPYTKAYNYRENYATVMCDIKWDYYHDKKNEDGTTENEYVEVTSNEMRIVDRSGGIMFDSRKNYYSELGWTANERFVEPLSRFISSLGSYYFDHGYTRMRIQSYDRYYFTELNSVFIVSDEDVLVDPRGNKYHIPTGYRLVSYSDGIMLLEKDGLYGYMNTSGVWIKIPDMQSASPFLEGVAVCTDSNGMYGVIGRNGNVLIPFKYNYISNISSGTLCAFSNSEGWKIYQKMKIE